MYTPLDLGRHHSVEHSQSPHAVNLRKKKKKKKKTIEKHKPRERNWTVHEGS
jgi:hypothetical protein